MVHEVCLQILIALTRSVQLYLLSLLFSFLVLIVFHDHWLLIGWTKYSPSTLMHVHERKLFSGNPENENRTAFINFRFPNFLGIETEVGFNFVGFLLSCSANGLRWLKKFPAFFPS